MAEREAPIVQTVGASVRCYGIGTEWPRCPGVMSLAFPITVAFLNCLRGLVRPFPPIH